MSENENIITEQEAPRESKRLRWIDQARGFIMLYLVITIVFPESWTKDFTDPTGNILTWTLHFLFDHAGTSATYMTLFDIGAASFIFLLGLMMSVSYHSRSEKYGKGKAAKHIAIRYAILTMLGLLIMLINEIDLHEIKNGMFIISWDVVPAIAAAGWITFAAVQIPDPKKRIIVGYGIAILYQLLMIFSWFKAYAISSVHGGIYGGFLGYGSISIIASALGDYMFNSKSDEEKKYKNMLIFGILNLAIGIALSYVSGFEASKRQVSLTHNLISIGVTVIGLWVFSYLDRKKNMEMGYLRAYGMNPFFVYFIVEVPNLLVKEIVGTDLGISPDWVGPVILTIVYVAYTSIIMLRLYKKGKVISTGKAALIMLLVSIVLFALILAFFPDIL